MSIHSDLTECSAHILSMQSARDRNEWFLQGAARGYDDASRKKFVDLRLNCMLNVPVGLEASPGIPPLQTAASPNVIMVS